jgi:8-oxo-dGTP diphosphatase
MSDVYCFKVRIGVALIRDGQLLLVRQNNRPFWVLPGGTLEPGEGMAECAAREVLEETGLSVSVDQLLYVADFIQGHGRQTVDIVFLAHYISGSPEMETTQNINEMAFFGIDDVRELVKAGQAEPRPMFEQLLRAWEGNFTSRSGFYLGKYGLT